ncbi:MAG: hypothetical protein IFNCLDLE_02691 [Ignavibacteriaceae bacterium]|nr:hypothetical protein [Ignavibacteriaceae bacterium]
MPRTKKIKGENTMPESSVTITETVKVGGVELTIQTRTVDHVPSGQKIEGYAEELSKLAYAVKTSKPALLVGETGVGKTALIRFIAQETKNGFRRLNLNGQTTVDEFVGKIMLNDKGTFWQDGVLLDAMRNGYWLLLDEINAALPEILFVLHSLLDDDGYVVLAEKDGEVVRPHKDFRIFASMNPSGRYVGTKELNKAFLSRFPMILQMDFPGESQEQKIIKLYAPKVDDKSIYNLVRMANDLRKAYKAGETNFMCSTRDLINCAVMSQDLGMKEALQMSIINRTDEDDLKAVTTITALYFGKTGKPVNITNYEEEYKKLQASVGKNLDNFVNILGAVQGSQRDTNVFLKNLEPAVKSGFMGEAIKTQYYNAYESVENTERMCSTFISEFNALRSK